MDPIDTQTAEAVIEPIATEVDPVAPDADADVAAFDAGVAEVTDAPGEEPTETVVDVVDPVAEADRVDAATSEADALGLKGKSNTRFRELAGEAAAFAPLKAAMAEHGIADAAQVRVLLQRGKDADAFNAYMADQGITADQFTATVTYTALATRGNNGDLKAAQQAFDAATAEQAHWAKMLGKEVPGSHDPLAEHDDLIGAVETGDMTRKFALEIAQARAKEAVTNTRTQALTAQQQRDEAQQQAAQQAQDQAINEVSQLNANLKATDPANFASRVGRIDYAAIRQLPPHLWAAKIEAAYWRVPPVPVPARVVPVGAVPLRPTGGSGPMQQVPKNDLEAFSMGAASVR